MTEDILGNNFFQLFDVPVSYEVDLDLIQQRYRELQKSVHPDRFASASDQEKRISMQQTSWINEAFNTLRKPLITVFNHYCTFVPRQRREPCIN